MENDVPNMTNKIVGIVIALVMVATILVPITNISTGNGGGNGGGNSEYSSIFKLSYYDNSNPGDNPYLTNEDYEYYDDVSYSESSYRNTNVRFAPNHDGRTYKEGEVIAYLWKSYDFQIITYSNNSLKVWGEVDGEKIDYTINGLVIGSNPSGPGSSNNYACYLDSANDNTFKTEDMADFTFYSGLLKSNNSLADTFYITQDSSVSIKVNDASSIPRDTQLTPTSYIIRITSKVGGNIAQDDIEYASSDYDDEGNEYAIDWSMVEQIPDYEDRCKLPISLNKWNVQFSMDVDGESTSFKLEPIYLIFDSRIPFESSGSTGTGGGDNGTVGTLISMIPIFVTLALLGAVVGMFMNKRNLI